MTNPNELERAVERLSVTVDWLADKHDDDDNIAPPEAHHIVPDLRLILSANREMGERLESAAKYLCRLEGAMLADDLDMKLNFPGEMSPTAMAESILPGFDSIEYDLARSALTTQ